jgi:DMSO/TMAO reductase YedYZ molybdopterin-dependent catalytic subunit
MLHHTLAQTARRILTLASLFAALGCLTSIEIRAVAQATADAATLKIAGAVKTPLTLSISDLKAMPRKTVSVLNSHSNKTEAYEGVLVADLLAKAGVPHGEELSGPKLATYVLAEAADGYRVVFSLAELDPGFLDSGVLLADTMDGAPLAKGQGSFKLVALHEKRPARWVRMLKSLTVVELPKP